jgi:hypothetical protein
MTSKHHSGEDEDCLLASLENHQGAINGLHFNPHPESSHLLASGGSDCEVYVTTLERPDEPTVFVPAPAPNNSKHTADITKVAWNTQVAHILASAAQNGSTFIWDLRQKKAWCELRDPAGGMVSDVAWNPEQVRSCAAIFFATQCCAKPRYAALLHANAALRNSRYAGLCCAVQCCFILRCFMLRYAALCCAALCCAASCCVMLRYAALCCVVLRCAAL